MKNFLAALTFFTRLPLWRIAEIPADCYKRVVEFWPLVGWLTGGVTALILWGLLFCLPPVTAVIAAYAARLLLTGALHEDGLADFFDGMGGGRSKEGILRIMKDSHIGSYGVISLIIYFLLLISSVASLPRWSMPLVVLAADSWGKFCGELMVSRLPYARTAEEAKNKTVYTRIKPLILLSGCIVGLLPSLLLPPAILFALILPVLVAMLLIWYMRYKIDGYTGDCCGATFLCCELAYIISAAAIFNITSGQDNLPSLTVLL